MFASDPEAMLRIVVVGTLAYAALIAWLRVSGKRTLSKWNAFDFVVTIGIGSMLATTAVSRTIGLAEGVTALGLFVLLQFAITWLAVRSPRLERWIKARPALLVWNGEMLHDAMKRERVTAGEVRAAVRNKGIAAVETVAAVVLETDGSFSVIRDVRTGRASALADVGGMPQAAFKAEP